MILGLDIYQFLGLVANFMGLATSIIVFVAVFRVMHFVRHSCLPLIGLSSILGGISSAIFVATEFPMISYPLTEYLFAVSCVCYVIGSIAFAVGTWQLLHWIPELLDLRALDQRDEPFDKSAE